MSCYFCQNQEVQGQLPNKKIRVFLANEITIFIKILAPYDMEIVGKYFVQKFRKKNLEKFHKQNFAEKNQKRFFEEKSLDNKTPKNLKTIF